MRLVQKLLLIILNLSNILSFVLRGTKSGLLKILLLILIQIKMLHHISNIIIYLFIYFLNRIEFEYMTSAS